MKKICFYFILLSIIVIQNGCTKLLEENPKSVLSPATFYKTNADFDASIGGALRDIYNGYNVFSAYNALLVSGGAEDISGKFDNLYDIMKPDVNGPQALVCWKGLYKCANECNTVIAKLPLTTSVTDADKKSFEAQARYIRALCYFYLTRWFGSIQLILTPEDQANALKIKESSVADVYAQIVTDLKYAEDNLPVSALKTRPTKGAAAAMLAEAYLTMAGWPLKDATKYALARDEAQKVINMGIYQLEPVYNNLWLVANKLTNKETIFIFNAIGTGQSSSFHRSGRPGEEGGWQDFTSEGRLLAIFPDGPRKTATFHTQFVDKNKTMWYNSGAMQPFCQKWYDAGAGGGPNTIYISGTGQTAFAVNRYAEVLLIYAEAANMAEGGPSAAALDAINQVRRRGGGYNQAVWPDLPSGMTKVDFDKKVIEERLWEFSTECKRWFDLVRKEMVVEVNISKFPYVNAHNQLLPKPQDEVNLLKGMLTQNPGY